MLSLKLNNVYSFMGTLLTQETFDKFMVSEASVSTFNDFHMDGHLNKDFFIDEEPEQKETYSTWKMVRPICYSLIKGKKTPLRFKFILLLPRDEVQTLLASYGDYSSAIDLLFVIKFDGTSLNIVTATSTNTFLPDKSFEAVWDTYFTHFLTNLGIDYTSLL